MKTDVKKNFTCEILKNDNGMIVTYWPSDQPSIKKQVYLVEGIRVLAWRVEFGAISVPIGSRWMSNNYTTGFHWQLDLVGFSLFEFELQFEAVRTSSRQRTPVEQPSRIKKMCCYDQRSLGSICCSLFRLQLTSHTQLFRKPFATLSIMCERYIFLKNCVRSSLLLIMFPRVYVYV